MTSRFEADASHRAAQRPQQTHRLVMYTPSGSGGHATYSAALLEALHETGRVDARLVTERGATGYDTVPVPVHTVVQPLRLRESFSTRIAWVAGRLTEYVRRERAFLQWLGRHRQYRLIHVQEYSPLLFAWHIRRMHRGGHRVCATVHNVRPHQRGDSRLQGVVRAVRVQLLRAAWRRCDVLLVHSEELADALRADLGRRAGPICVTPHGVWSRPIVESAPPAEGRGARLRLLFFGVLRPNKGLTHLLEAMAKLEDAELVIAGQAVDTSYMLEIDERIAALPVGRVTLDARFVPDDELPTVFARTDVLVLPYGPDFVAQSGVLHDAIAHGIPVVAAPAGALGATVNRLGIGTVAESNAPDAIVTAVRALAVPEQLVAAREACARARAELTWGASAQATLRAYDVACS